MSPKLCPHAFLTLKDLGGCGCLGSLSNNKREALEFTHCWIKLELVVHMSLEWPKNIKSKKSELVYLDC